jgi:hypothetical protein
MTGEVRESYYARGSLFHMRKRVFCYGEHLQDIATEGAFHVLQVDLREILTHDLLGCVVHQDVYFSVSLGVSQCS